jgi:Ca-activated chloride channel family protein
MLDLPMKTKNSSSHWRRTTGAVPVLLFAFGLPNCSSDVAMSSGSHAQSSPTSPGVSGNGTQVPQGTNVGLGGSQDFGFFRSEVEAGRIPSLAALDAAGFFAEHHSELPPPACGERICLQPLVAVMGNLINGSNCTMLQLGLNSPLSPDPSDRPPLSLAVVVDVSGSMSGEKLAFVQQGLELLVDGMRDDDELSLVSYSDRAQVRVEMSPVRDQRIEFREAVRGLGADGGTNLTSGLDAGYRQVLSHFQSDHQNRVILLSDGNPTVGIIDSSSIVELSRGFNSEGIGLTTVGLGSDFNVNLMRDLALQADGNFYFLEDAGAVNEVFEEELSYFTVPVAFDLKVELARGSDYSFGRALGTPFWTDTNSGGVLEVPSVFLAHRESDEDVTEEDGRRGGGSALLVELMPLAGSEADEGASIATIDVSFREPGSDERIEDQITVDYPHAPGVLKKEGYFAGDDIATVQKSFVMLNIYVGMEMVVHDFWEDRATATTTQGLDNLIAAVEDYNDEIGDVDIELDLALLRQLRQNLVQDEAPAERAPPLADPWPAD